MQKYLATAYYAGDKVEKYQTEQMKRTAPNGRREYPRKRKDA